MNKSNKSKQTTYMILAIILSIIVAVCVTYFITSSQFNNTLQNKDNEIQGKQGEIELLSTDLTKANSELESSVSSLEELNEQIVILENTKAGNQVEKEILLLYTNAFIDMRYYQYYSGSLDQQRLVWDNGDSVYTGQFSHELALFKIALEKADSKFALLESKLIANKNFDYSLIGSEFDSVEEIKEQREYIQGLYDMYKITETEMKNN